MYVVLVPFQSCSVGTKKGAKYRVINKIFRIFLFCQDNLGFVVDPDVSFEQKLKY